MYQNGLQKGIICLWMVAQKTFIVHITLKISCHQLTEILQSFRRYGYGILVEKEDDFYREELKEISRYFEKYITF